jgi:hypothetical protein
MKINEMLTESQLDELKCWTGYKRVPGMPVNAPGSCRKATSEETEQLDELSPKTLARYKKAAGASARAADKAGDFEKGNKRFSGIVRATKKEFDHDAKKRPKQGVAEGLGDTKTEVVGKYKGWRFEIETQTEDDRYVKYYGAVSPDGKWHSLPKRATSEQFKQFVDSKGVNEGDVPAQYLSGKEKVSNISPVLTKPYGSAKQTKLMKNFFGSS